MPIITTENINTLAQLAASIMDGDYIYIYKSASNSFARIEKSVFLSGITGGGAPVSTVTNVNILRAKIDELIAALAPLAFNGEIPAAIGNLDWDSDIPSIPMLLSPVSGSYVNVGTNRGDGVSKTISVLGSGLTQPLVVSVEGEGFVVYITDISAATANAGTDVSVVYNGTTANAVGTLTISSGEVNCIINLTASYSESSIETTHNVAINSSGLSGCSYSSNLPGTGSVVDGGSVVIYISPANSATHTLEGVTATVSATNGSVSSSYDPTNDRIIITVSNITSDSTITIAATAAEKSVAPSGYVTNGLVLNLDCTSRGGQSGKWIDTIADVEFALTNCTESNSGVIFNGTSSFGIADIPENWPSYDVGTVEFVAKSMTIKNKATALKTNTTGGIMNGYWYYPTTQPRQSWVGSVNAKPQQRGSDTLEPNDTFDGYVGLNQSACVVNGIEKTMMSLNDTFTYHSSTEEGTITLGRCANSSNSKEFTSMTLLAVRVYSRRLSVQEMLQNYNADKAKYGIS